MAQTTSQRRPPNLFWIHKWLKRMARPAGLEPATLCLEGRCSVRLSYGRDLRNSNMGAHGSCSCVQTIRLACRFAGRQSVYVAVGRRPLFNDLPP